MEWDSLSLKLARSLTTAFCLTPHDHVPTVRFPAWPCRHLSLWRVLQHLISRHLKVIAFQSCFTSLLLLLTLLFPCLSPCLDSTMSPSSGSNWTLIFPHFLCDSSLSLLSWFLNGHRSLAWTLWLLHPTTQFWARPTCGHMSASSLGHTLTHSIPMHSTSVLRKTPEVSPFQPHHLFVTLESVLGNYTSKTIQSPY